jgi:hypothetical protein
MNKPDETGLEYDWGGDGSDLEKTVRVHVEAALLPAAGAYSPPIDQLLSLGDPLEDTDLEARIAEMGFTQEHIPELVRMARDRELNTAPGDSDKVWAPIHALTALSHLDIGEYAADLVPLFDVDSEWFGEELPLVLKNARANALAPLQAYIQDTTRWIFGRAYAISAVEELAKAHPEVRDQAIQFLSDALTHAGESDPYINADLINALAQLHAVEALPIVRQAFEQDAVDESIMGDWTEVLKAFGQEVDQDDPLVRRSRQRWNEQRAQLRTTLPPSPRAPTSLFALTRTGQNKAAKRKNKRKQASAARKANKKKRK